MKFNLKVKKRKTIESELIYKKVIQFLSVFFFAQRKLIIFSKIMLVIFFYCMIMSILMSMSILILMLADYEVLVMDSSLFVEYQCLWL